MLKNDFLEDEIVNNRNKMKVNNSNEKTGSKSGKNEFYIINEIL